MLKNISKNLNIKNIIMISLGIIIILNLLKSNLLGIERFIDYDELI